MGAVWVATDRVLGRRVALKRLGRAPGAASPDLERAEREARLAASLNHPHVVAVYDLVTDEDEHWLVMEYVEGRTLSTLVRDSGPLAIDQAAPVIAQAADALAAAHAAGIVHRDVKPSNILVGDEGEAKLSDFGIARAEADAALTQTGLVTGSPAYLAPEVASGQQATGASDVWSLGATLFHALSGHPPYEVGDNVLGALYRIVHEEPPRLAEAGWLDPLLRATMATDPAHRWTAEQVRDFLAGGPSAPLPSPPPAPAYVPGSEGGETRATPAVGLVPASAPVPPAERRSRRGRGALIALGLLVAAAIVVPLWWLLSGDEPDRPQAGTEPTPTATASSTPEPAVTADDLENFVEDYLATVTTDPASTWERLTPGFQEQSGGFEKYRSFWSGFRNADLLSSQADPNAMTISYTVEYLHRNGRKTSDDVTLQFELSDGQLLIAGEA